MDDLLLQEVDDELPVTPNEHADDADLIRSVTLNTAWNNSKVQLAQDIFVEYLDDHAKLMVNERLVEAFMELRIEFRADRISMLP
jgi:hypothetical protein